MIKRPFFALSRPVLPYDLLEPSPPEPETVPVPGRLNLLLQESIDGTRPPMIKTGDAVQKGDKLTLYPDSRAYTTSPVNGTIMRIDDYPGDFGQTATCIVVKAGADTGTPESPAVTFDDLNAAADCLMTLPGAPPMDILADDERKISTLVITCADTDLLSTTAQYIGTCHAKEIRKGALILKQLSGVSRICVTLPQGLAVPEPLTAFQILRTGPAYPDALPAMVMKHHLDRVLPAGRTPEEMGICFIRAEAVASLGRAGDTHSPVYVKRFTLVDPQGNRQRVQATIGTPLSDIFSHLQLPIDDNDRIIIGGPMQGKAVFTLQHPVTPDMDTLIVQTLNQIPETSDYPCVNCGKCIQICPANIPVNLLIRYLEVSMYEEAADKFDLMSCIDCGLCSYVCTAKIPLGQYIRLGKHELQKLRMDA